jgi:hypothetical protein
VKIEAKLGRIAPRECEVVFVGTRGLKIESADIYRARMRHIPHAVIARLDRATQYSRGGRDGIERPRRTGSSAFAEDDEFRSCLDGFRKALNPSYTLLCMGLFSIFLVWGC